MNTELINVSAISEVVEISLIEQGKKIADAYWAKAFKMIQANPYLINSKVLCLAVSHRAPDYLLRLILLGEPSLYCIPLQDSKTPASTIMRIDLSPPNTIALETHWCGGIDQLRFTSHLKLLEWQSLGWFNQTIFISVHQNFTSSCFIREEDSARELLGTTVPLQINLEQTTNTDNILQLERRLDIARNLDLTNTTELLCIQRSYTAILKSRKQVMKAMLELQRQICTICVSIGIKPINLVTPAIADTTIKIGDVKDSNSSNEFDAWTSRMQRFRPMEIIDYSMEDDKQGSERSGEGEASMEGMLSPSVTGIYVKLSAFGKGYHGQQMNNVDSHALPSPSYDTCTYRSDETFENIVASRDASMPFFYMSPLKTKKNDLNDDLRSLLSRTTKVSRYQSHYLRRRTFTIGKRVLPRLCLR
jgi:hypothetical protein